MKNFKSMSLSIFLLSAMFLALSLDEANAHSQSYGYLSIKLNESSVEGSLDLAARDLASVFDFDNNHDASLTWGEFRQNEAQIVREALGKVSIGPTGEMCNLLPKPALTDSRGGETYIVIPFESACRIADRQFDVSYDLLFNLDAQHRGLVAVVDSSGTQSFVMTPDQSKITVNAAGSGKLEQFMTYVVHGAHHIWIGFDHILFLITLLLGTFMVSGQKSARAVLLESFKVVTAFTISHSVTLALAALDILRIPVPLAESLIAATIVLAAINNIWPIMSRRIWLVALAFGLIHGVGFANVLADLGLPSESLMIALFGFNAGVELGQLAIVVLAFPIVAAVMRYANAPVTANLGNMAIAAIGALWFSDRALGTAILPF